MRAHGKSRRRSLSVGRTLGAALCCLVWASDAAAQQCEFSPALRSDIHDAARSLIGAAPARPASEARARAVVSNALSVVWPTLVARTAAESWIDAEALRTASARGEATRTDVQLGAPPGASGTTTLTESAALPLLLGLAVEYGAITQESNGTSTTFGTSPYAFLLIGNEDSDAFYQRHVLARSFGVSANVSLDPSKGMNDLEPSDFSSLTAKYTLGDRSTRSRKFQNEWKQAVRPQLQEVVARKSALLASVLPSIEGALADLERLVDDDPNRQNTTSRVAELLMTMPSNTPEARVASVDAALQRELCGEVYAFAAQHPPRDLETVPNLRALLLAIDELSQSADRETQALIQNFRANQPLFSFVYEWNNTANGSDYSQFALIGDGLFGDLGGTGLRLVLNAWVAVNHDPSSSLGQGRVRDYAASLELEKRFRNFLTAGVAGQDPSSQMALSLAAQYQRLEDIDANLGTVQARLLTPIAAGFSLPLSLSWSSRSQTSRRDEFKVGIGIAFDADTLRALTRLQR